MAVFVMPGQTTGDSQENRAKNGRVELPTWDVGCNMGNYNI